MKTMKKFFALLLALTMALALGLPAFAADETGSITVDNPLAGQTYTAYKIFDVTYDATKTAYSYTIDSSSEWFTTVQQYATTANGLTLTQVTGATTYIVTTTDKFSAPSFANALKAAVAGKTGTALTVADGKAKVEGLPLGYYFVSSTSGALCNLTTTNPTATIHDKNDIPFTKTVDRHSYELGEDITYTLTTKVPDYTGHDVCSITIMDRFDVDFMYNHDVAVAINGSTDNVDFHAISPIEGMLTISVNNLTEFPIGAEIQITYSLKMNDTGNVFVNEATLFSNGLTIGPVTASVYGASIFIDKYALNAENPEDHSQKLDGAEFILYKIVTESETEKKLYYKLKKEERSAYNKSYTQNTVEWTENKNEATTVTSDSSVLWDLPSFDGVADGTYYLEEIKAPDGYNLLQEPVKVVVDGSASIDPENPDKSGLRQTISIANQTGAELPSTGGIGTTIFYVLGGLLVVGAAVLLITKKRMAEQ